MLELNIYVYMHTVDFKTKKKKHFAVQETSEINYRLMLYNSFPYS